MLCQDSLAGDWVQSYLLELVHNLEDMLPLGQLSVHLFAASSNTGSIDGTTSKKPHCLFSKLPKGIRQENGTTLFGDLNVAAALRICSEFVQTC